MADGEGMDAAYVRDGVLFPGYLDWEVRGGFDPSSLPEELPGAEFLYPLSYASELEGTIVSNSRQVDDLAALLVRRGYSASVVSTPLELSELSWEELASRFASGSDFAKIASAVGLILLACSLISAGRHLRDGRERMWVRHLYGLTTRRMMGAPSRLRWRSTASSCWCSGPSCGGASVPWALRARPPSCWVPPAPTC